MKLNGSVNLVWMLNISFTQLANHKCNHRGNGAVCVMEGNANAIDLLG